MKERSDVTKSVGSNVFMSMAIMGKSADDHGKESADHMEEESGNH